MIHIKRGDIVAGNENLRVETKTGDYEDTALIEFYDVNDPEETVIGAFQAQCVKYGSLVYRFNDPRELGAAILKIDPDSTHAAASFVRLNAELLRQLNDGSLNPSSLDEAIVVEKGKVEDQIIKPVEEVEEIDIEPITPDVPATPISPSTTTPIIDVPVIDLPEDDTSTTTPTIPTDTEVTPTLPTIDAGEVIDTVIPANNVVPAAADAEPTMLEDILDVVSPQVSDIVTSIRKGIAKSKKVSKIAKNVKSSTKKKR